MVGPRLGAQVSVEQLRQKMVPGPQGLSLQQLRDLAGDIGLHRRAVRVSVERAGPGETARRSRTWKVVTMSCFTSWSDTGVVIGDPASGIVTWKPSFLGQCYDRIAAYLRLAEIHAPRARGESPRQSILSDRPLAARAVRGWIDFSVDGSWPVHRSSVNVLRLGPTRRRMGVAAAGGRRGQQCRKQEQYDPARSTPQSAAF